MMTMDPKLIDFEDIPSKLSPSIPAPGQNKAQRRLRKGLSGPCFGMGAGIEGGTSE